MISREHLANLRTIHGRENHQYQINKQPDTWVALNDLLDTLDAALKVVEAAKALNPELHSDPRNWALAEALAPFTAPRGKE